MEEIAKKFLVFNRISNKLQKIDYNNEEEVKNMEKLINYYIENYKEQGDCLIKKFNTFK